MLKKSVKQITEKQYIGAALLLLPLIYFWPAVLGRIVLMTGDGASYYLFMHLLTRDLILHGELPLWNPYIFGGMPFLAAIQPGVLYPPNWLFLILPTAAAVNAGVLANYYITLVGTYFYARAIGVSRIAAFISSIAFTFSGFLLMHLDQSSYVAGISSMPWILLAAEKLYGEASSATWRYVWRWMALGAIFIALQFFAGIPQASWQTALVGGAYIIFALFGRLRGSESWRARKRFAISVALMAISGALLSAIQFLPARELQQQGERAQLSYETFAGLSMPSRTLLTLVFPFFFGGGMKPFFGVSAWDHWWLHKWVNGYVGLIVLLLALIAIFSAFKRGKHSRLIFFWSAIASAGLLLSLGDNLPFGVNHLLHNVPVYNLFRGSYRQLVVFTFGTAILAGYGVDLACTFQWQEARRIFIRSAFVFIALVACVAIAYVFFGSHLGAANSVPPGGSSWKNRELVIPVLLAIASVVLSWKFMQQRTVLLGSALVLALMIDLGLFGWSVNWRETSSDLSASIKDPPAVKAIKDRETDLRSFRIITQPIWPHGPIFSAINHANLTILRSLQSLSGYEPMRLQRPALIAGDLDIYGEIRDETVFAKENRGLDLLNVKYLLRERNRSTNAGTVVPVRTLIPRARFELEADSASYDELEIVSMLVNSGAVTDGSPVANIKLHTDESTIEVNLLAGRDTSEWAYERPDVQATVKHGRAQVAESWDGGGFQGHRYSTRIPIRRSRIDYIEISNPGDESHVVIAKAELSDSMSGQKLALRTLRLNPERWRHLGTFDNVELWENLNVLPRAWFVNRVMQCSDDEALSSIKQGKVEPRQTALVDRELAASSGKVEVVSYAPNRIEMTTETTSEGFLVVSEVYYNGWEAFLDGVRVPVYRTDYALRGISVPAGKHRVEMRFRPASVGYGAVLSLLGCVLLFVGWFVVPALAGTNQNETG